MLIGIDASRANKKEKTGVEWYSYHLIEQFKKLDNEDRFFLYTNKPLIGDLSRCPSNFEERLLKWPIPRSWTLGRLSLEMKFGRPVPDVLFVPAHTIPLFNPKRSVVTVHDIGFEHLPEAYPPADKIYHKLTIQFIKRFADRIIAPSHYTKKDLIETYRIAPEKITVVHNGKDENYRMMPSAREKIKKFNLFKPYFLFTGRLENKKNIVGLVSAFAIFKKKYPADPRQLVLIGRPGRGDGWQRAQAKIKEFDLDREVVSLGWVGHDDLSALTAAADLFVFPSLFEGFGIPVAEAMSSGCPVICSNTTSLPEVAGDAALLFDPKNVDEIVEQMEAVAFNDETRKRLIAKGLEQSKKFSWEKSARETLAVLKSV